jgi:hypothetical protein
VRKSVGRAMFETAQLLMRQQAALSSPQAPAPVETPLTPEQHAAKARRDNIAGWQTLHERYQREAEANQKRRYL